MKFDLVNTILTDSEIEELQALCADCVTEILRDINDYDTLKAAKRWLKQCIDELYAKRAQRDRDNGYTFSSEIKFFYNRPKYDQRYKFQTEYYTTVSRIVAARLLEFEDRWSDYDILVMGKAITEGLQSWYDSGRKIPKNQYWEEDFEVDRILWRLMTQMQNMPVSYQRDTPFSADTWIVQDKLVYHMITNYMRMILNAAALCSLIETTYEPDADEALFDDNLADMASIRLMVNLSRLLPGLMDKLLIISGMLDGGVL